MATTPIVLERPMPNQPNYFYIIGYPVCYATPTKQLLPVESELPIGLIQGIVLDAKGRYCITFKGHKKFVLTAKKVLNTWTNPDNIPVTDLLATDGYQLDTELVTPLSRSAQFSERLATILPLKSPLTTLPSHYIVVDCEFGWLFKKTANGQSINWQQTTIAGAHTSIYQLSALGFNQTQSTSVYFNRYLDNPYFLLAKKLTGLRETGLTLAEYEQQSDPVTVLKAFIATVLTSGLPLVFWNQRNDLQNLQWLLAYHYQDLTPAEQATITAPIEVFDCEQYTNQVINRSSNQQLTTVHDLPLNGVAGLLNIVNPNQHNAIWDALTIHHVMRQLTAIRATEPTILTAPQHPQPTRIPPLTKNQRVHQLRAAGKTYREIALALGISISGVNYILKKTATTE